MEPDRVTASDTRATSCRGRLGTVSEKVRCAVLRRVPPTAVFAESAGGLTRRAPQPRGFGAGAPALLMPATKKDSKPDDLLASGVED